MKQTLTLFALLACLLPARVMAQLPDGSTAPDFTLTEIDGVTHHLSDYLDQGKVVALDFSATWCGPCWNYANTGAMETFWEDHGPSGDNTAMALFIEADESTGMNDLLGLTGSSQGNWVSLIPFPIIDLVPANSTDEDYSIAYYPTLYMVCTDYKVYEVGQIPASEWAEWIQSCMLAGSVDDVVDAVCGEDGSVSLDVEGGVQPLEYDWSNGDNSPTLQGVSGGVYSVTITEGNGKDVVIEDIVVDGPEAPLALAGVSILPASCFQEPSGSLDVEIEAGTTPYSFAWSNGDNTEDLEDVPAGSYTVIVTDGNDCELTETFEVGEPDPIAVEHQASPSYCGNPNGVITIEEITGGTGDYDITASAGTINGNTISNLPVGPVTITVTDENDCVYEEEITIEEGPELWVFIDDEPITCTTPIATLEGVTGNGSGEFVYNWTTNDGNFAGPTDQSTVLVDQPGEYQLEVYDLLTECLIIESTTVVSTVDPPAVSAGNDVPMTCETPQLMLEGSGDPELSVTWTTDDGNIVSGGNTYTPVVDQPGLYIITVMDPVNQCTNTDFVFVDNALNPASASFTYQTADLTFLGTDLSGGSNLSSWSWTFGDGNSSTEANPVYTYATSGTYQVCLTVQNGCGPSTTCQTVEVVAGTSAISVNVNIGNVLCHGDSTGTIAIEVNGGSGNYTYIWTGPGGVTYTTPSIADLPAGVYVLVINDDLGNVFNGVYTVTEPGDIVLVGSTVVDNLCFGQSNGAITVDITGGVTPFTYSLNNGPAQAENTFANLPGGGYECIVTDANGCAFLAGPYTIAEPTAVGIDAAVTGVRCHGESNGQITVTGLGGIAPYTYLWTGLNITEPAVAGLAAGLYTCQVTDHNGCISGFDIAVSEPDTLDVFLTEVTHATGASQDNGSIVLVPTGGTAPYLINWSNGATGDTLTGLVPGEYAYVITDANGCTYTSPAPVVITGSTSTADVAWAGALGLSPNPSRGEAVLSWTDLPSDRGTVHLFTADGRLVGATELNARTGQWDLTSMRLQSGLYMVTIRIDQEVVTKKLVVL